MANVIRRPLLPEAFFIGDFDIDVSFLKSCFLRDPQFESVPKAYATFLPLTQLVESILVRRTQAIL